MIDHSRPLGTMISTGREDRALLGSNPSALAGPKQARGTFCNSRASLLDIICFGLNAINPSYDGRQTITYYQTGGTYVTISWGLYFQRAGENAKQDMAKFHNVGIKCISFYKASGGPITSFAIELGARGSLDYTPIYRTHWSWTSPDQGGPIRWTGPQNYFDAPDFTGVYNRLNPRYGGPQATYPDGTAATGYLSKWPGLNGDPSTDPRNSRVWDAGLAKSILGDYCGDIGFNDAVNEIDPKTGLPKGPLRGLIPMPDGRYTSHLSYHKDDGCPFWTDFTHASALYGADQGLDGIWADNYSAIAGFGINPVLTGFGEWSVARFRAYLKTHFTAAQLTAMGVVDPDSFNLRTALRARVRALGGDDTNLTDSHWNDASWLDDPIWRAYKIFKRQAGTEAVTNFYNSTKAAAAEAGKPDFLIQGNDIPFFSLGWVRGNLDQVSTEMTAGWHFGSSSRGVMLPPVGRFAPIYKLAREHAKSRLVNVWMYVDGPYQGKPGIAQVLQYEMLATDTLPMHHPGNPTVIGTAASNAAFFKFVQDATPVLGLRMPVADVGIYYSTSSVLDFMTPAFFLDMDHQPHQHAYYGWGTALGELHCQYRAIPEWKLTTEMLKGLRVLIIPNAEVLDKSDVTSTIEPWVRAGGRLIVTGDSGQRQGETGNFDSYATLSLDSLTSVSTYATAPTRKLGDVGLGKVLYLRSNLGMNYFNADTQSSGGSQRAALIGQFSQAMTDVLAGQGPLVLASSAPDSVGLNVYEDARARRLFIDANNLDIDLASDTVHPAPTVHFQVQLPDWIKGLGADQIRLYVLSPDKPAPAASLSLLPDGRADVTLGAFTHYASVILEYPNQAPHWRGYE